MTRRVSSRPMVRSRLAGHCATRRRPPPPAWAARYETVMRALRPGNTLARASCERRGGRDGVQEMALVQDAATAAHGRQAMPTVLLVEDDPAIALLVLGLLSDAGYR